MASRLRSLRQHPRFRQGRGRERFPAADHWVAGRRGRRSRGAHRRLRAPARRDRSRWELTLRAGTGGPDARVELIVIGAGAAGLWAAARAAELGCEVLVLEKTPRTGTKVLASGGTRCNLTTTLGLAEAARLFGPAGERFLRGALRVLSPANVRERFEALGVPTVAEPLEKIFPASHRARDVRDALEGWARGAGARIECDSAVLGFEHANGEWRVSLQDGRVCRARKLCVCPGGMSYPRTGTTGDGYAWLAALGLPLVEPVPALVPLLSPEPWVRELAGVSLQEVDVELRAPDGARVAARTRPIVFTHKGISGPGAMDLSEPVAREEARATGRAGRAARAHSLRLDLAPALERERLQALLASLAGRPGAPLLARLARERARAAAPDRLRGRSRRGAWRRLHASTSSRAPRRHALVEAVKGLAIPITGTLGFDAGGGHRRGSRAVGRRRRNAAREGNRGALGVRGDPRSVRPHRRAQLPGRVLDGRARRARRGAGDRPPVRSGCRGGDVRARDAAGCAAATRGLGLLDDLRDDGIQRSGARPARAAEARKQRHPLAELGGGLGRDVLELEHAAVVAIVSQ